MNLLFDAFEVAGVAVAATLANLVIQDGTEEEYAIGSHEAVSSSDPFFCRPLMFEEIPVDAVTCPSPLFSSW